MVPREGGRKSVMNRRARGGWIGWVIVLILVGVGVYAWPRGGRERVMALYTQVQHKPSPSAKPPQRDVPVVAAVAKKGELPIHIDGLGTVTPFQSVTVRSRVDGELLRVDYKEGSNVREGDLLAEIDPRPFLSALEQAQGKLNQDNANLANARVDLKRYQDAGAVVSTQQRQTQAALVNQLEGQIKSDQAQVETAKVQLSYTKITAPLSGQIGLRRLDAGNLVRASDPNGLVVITQLQPIAVLFSIPQDQISAVNKKFHGAAPLEVDAYDRDLKNKLATGVLMAVDNQVDQSTGTVTLKAKFENTDSALFPNQFVNARLRIEVLRGAVLVPAAAVQRGPSSVFAYVVKADNTVEMRPIKQGPTEGDITSIESGLAAGETVVTDGADKLTVGTKVLAKLGGDKEKAPGKDGGAGKDAAGKDSGAGKDAAGKDSGAGQDGAAKDGAAKDGAPADGAAPKQSRHGRHRDDAHAAASSLPSAMGAPVTTSTTSASSGEETTSAPKVHHKHDQ